MTSPETDFLPVARDLALQAGRRLMELRETTLVRERKADHSLVTNADREADRIIRDGLRTHFPGHAVITEESGLSGRPDEEFVWMVDPLDGTKAYARGAAGFSVMIGLLRQGKPFAGVVFDPWEGHLHEAQSGAGSFHTLNGQRTRVQVSKRREWTEMPLVTSTGFPEGLAKKIREKLPCPWAPAANSVGIKVGFLVRHIADLYFNHHPVHYWDTAAPQIILEEAGGVFTFSDGTPLTYDLESAFHHAAPTLATNGQRHSEFVSIITDLLQT